MSRRENLEAMVIAWLRDLVPGYPASSDTPKTLPKQFILVERTGGAREAMLGDNAAVSSTHLTLPTIHPVQISVVAVS